MISVSAKLTWNGPACLELIRTQASARVERAATVLFDEVVKALDVPGPPASRPGDPPHRVKGDLKRGVVRYFDGRSWVVGLAPRVKRQGLALELGTRRMQARPFLLGTLRRVLTRLQAAAAGR